MKTSIQIYHNPRCSKSRETLALLKKELLKKNQAEPTVILYLEQPPSLTQLRQLLKKLGLTARDLLRTKEAEHKELKLDNLKLSDTQLLAAMIQCPKLIERPIVVCGEKAVLGRPPENVLDLL